MAVPWKLDMDACLSSGDEDEASLSRASSSLSHNGFDSGIGDITLFDLEQDREDTSQGPSYEKIEFPSVPNFMDLCNNNSAGSPVRVHTLPDRLALGLYSPPYKRVRALRLFDAKPTSPGDATDVTQTPLAPLPRSRLFAYGGDKAATVGGCPRSMTVPDKPSANVNPFTPNGLLLASKKRSRSKRSLTGTPPKIVPYPRDDSGNDSMLDHREDSDRSDQSDDSEEEQPTKKIALHESNISRYHQEFHEMCLIGKGAFGSVFKCLNRLDGCVYAVKKSLKPVVGSVNERLAMCEVYGLAALAKHNNVVSYYSAWSEDDHIYIQNEFCNGGNLAEAIETMRGSGGEMTKSQMKQLTLQVAEGLKFIHSKGLVHMDIKPANIFLSRETLRQNVLSSDSDEDEMPPKDENGMYVWYKIGDFGHVTSVCDPRVEEGDCRYLPNEILQERYDHLPKADIFSLGVTLYEAGGGGPIPKNGPEWHDIRAARLRFLPAHGTDFNALLKQMVDPDPARRPSASAVLHDPALGCETRHTLNHQLAAERLKTEILTRQLDEAIGCLKRLPKKMFAGGAGRRLCGKKTHRSHSTGSV